MHEQQIVHRDVKPQNLVLCERGVVLVDFGIAREVARRARQRDPWRRHAPVHGPGGAGRRGGLAAQRRVRARGDRVGADRGPAAHATTTRRRSPRGRGRDARARANAARGARAAPGAAVRLGRGARRRARLAARGLAGRVAGGQRRQAPSSAERLVEAIVRTAAGVFDAAAASLALVDAGDRRAGLSGRVGRRRGGDRRASASSRAGDRRRGRSPAARPVVVADCREDRALRRADRRGHRVRPEHDAGRAARARGRR